MPHFGRILGQRNHLSNFHVLLSLHIALAETQSLVPLGIVVTFSLCVI